MRSSQTLTPHSRDQRQGVAGRTPKRSCTARSLTLVQFCIFGAFLLLPGSAAYAQSAPTVGSAVTAASNPITARTTTLTVLGADINGEGTLTYTWSATGPAPVTFSSNGANASKSTTATFQTAGAYSIQAVIADANGLSVTSTAKVVVNQQVSRVTVNPPSATISAFTSQQFTASILDQFGHAFAQPAQPAGWTDLVNTHLQSVCPPDNFGGQVYPFYSLCPNVIAAWSGATADTLRNRLIIWGGGHQNYSGNEVFSLNLDANPPTMTRLTDPSVFNSNTQVCPESNLSDGTPVARETYNDLVYLPGVDRMFSFDGVKEPCGGGSGRTWTLDLSTSPPVWHAMDPVNGFNPAPVSDGGAGSVTGANCAYDPNTNSVFCSWGNEFGLMQYTYSDNTWKHLAVSGSDVVAGASTAVVDPVRRLLVFIGNVGDGVTFKVNAIDISGADPTYSVQDWTSKVSGCAGMNAGWPGVAYDPVLDRIVVWPGSGNTVYLLNEDTKTCSSQTYPNGPQISSGPANGTFGRFHYFPALNAYAVVNDANLDAYLLRLDSTSLGWSVGGGGFISGTGLLTAGSAGTTTIYASVGNVTGSAQITVMANTAPPAVTITAPASQSTVGGTVTITAKTTDAAAIMKVQFLLDGINLGSPVTGAGPTFGYSWNTTALFNGAALVNGPHTLAAIATDVAGNTATSANVSVTVYNPLGLTASLQLAGNATEVSGVANGSVVTPAIAPAGFTGKVVVNGSGLVTFTPALSGNGVYFLNCCVNGNNAYFKFTGATLGNIFNVNQGQIAFYLKSRYSLAQRMANAGAPRYAFDVQDVSGHHLFNFLTEVSGSNLFFSYTIAGTSNYYVAPTGTEDALFGNGVLLNVKLTWDGSVTNLYLNGMLAKSAAYAKPTANWAAGSAFDLGAYEYQTYGGFNTSDDAIAQFTVAGPNTAPPAVALAAPAVGATVNGVVTVVANATDPAKVAGVQFQLDGSNLGPAATGAGPSYSCTWNSKTVSNGGHTLTAVASDAAGNTATSSIPVMVNNDTTPPAVTITAPANGGTVNAAVTVIANATDNVGVTSVQFQLDGVNLGGPVTGAGPTYSYSWSTTANANGAHTLAVVASDAAGNTAKSSVSVTVNNVLTPAVASGVAASAISSSGATIGWTTDQASNSQVSYGATSSYGLLSPLSQTMVTAHSVNLSGLTASTTYHYQVLSQNAQGSVTASGDYTFTTAAAPVGPQPLLQMHLDATEVSSATNGSVVTPAIAPTGFTGKVVANGSGSVTFTPAQSGNGVYFLNCCVNGNNAYYKFTGATLGNIFNVNQGQITFFLKSRYSFGQRTANAAAPRYAFDVQAELSKLGDSRPA
jgi:Bacterial Ig domain